MLRIVRFVHCLGRAVRWNGCWVGLGASWFVLYIPNEVTTKLNPYSGTWLKNGAL